MVLGTKVAPIPKLKWGVAFTACVGIFPLLFEPKERYGSDLIESNLNDPF